MKGGTLTSAQYNLAASSIVHPLLANIISPGSNFESNPHFSVMKKFDVLSPQPCEIYATEPGGVMPIRNLAILWC